MQKKISEENFDKNLKNNEYLLLNKDKKKLKNIKGLSITSLVLILFSIVSLIVVLAAADSNSYNINNNNFPLFNETLSFFIAFIIFLFVFSIILSISGSITIIAVKWYSKYLEDNKILWSLLGLFLLGPIASLVFSCNKI